MIGSEGETELRLDPLQLLLAQPFIEGNPRRPQDFQRFVDHVLHAVIFSNPASPCTGTLVAYRYQW